jgi:hypothetical protein
VREVSYGTRKRRYMIRADQSLGRETSLGPEMISWTGHIIFRCPQLDHLLDRVCQMLFAGQSLLDTLFWTLFWTQSSGHTLLDAFQMVLAIYLLLDSTVFSNSPRRVSYSCTEHVFKTLQKDASVHWAIPLDILRGHTIYHERGSCFVGRCFRGCNLGPGCEMEIQYTI